MRADWRSEEFRNGFRRGDTAVLECLYWEHIDLVEQVLARGFVTRDGRNVPGVEDEEPRGDLMQEVFLKAFSVTTRATFDPAYDFRRYLLAIGRNVLVDFHRRSGRQPVTVDPAGDLGEALDATTEPEWCAPALVGVVEGYVAALVSPLREVHELRFVRGKSQRDAARALGVSRQNLRTFEARLKDGLRRALWEAQGADGPLGPALEARRAGPRLAAARGK